MKIYQEAVKKFENSKDKEIFYDLSQTFTGQQSLDLVQEIRSFLCLRQIQSIGLISKNSIFFPLWYLAADSLCKRIFFLPDKLQEEEINVYQTKYHIDLIVDNMQLDNLNHLNLKHLKNKNISPAPDRVDILFTSGTSSRPKGVVISEASFLHVTNTLLSKFKQTEKDLELLAMPFSHSFGLARLRCCLLSGSSALITDGLKDFPSVYKFSKDKPLTGLSLVPSGLEIIKVLLGKKAREFSSKVRYLEVGSSAMRMELIEWLQSTFVNTTIVHHYGMTEASRSFLKPIDNSFNAEIDINWLGHVLDKCEFKLINRWDQTTSNEGELLLKGPHLFSYYLNKTDQKHKYSNDWWHTGDVCELIDGKLFLVGRADNQFNIGGEKVQAEELENLIEGINEVKECLCFVEPSKIMGNRIICIVGIDSGTDIQKIRHQLDILFQKHPDFYKPKTVKYLETIPKTQNGKKIRVISRIENFLNEHAEFNK